MAKSRNTDPEAIPPSLSPDQAIKLLIQQKQKAEALLKKRPINEHEFDSWYNTSVEYLKKAFGSHSRNLSSICQSRLGIVTSDMDEGYFEQDRAESLERNIVMFDSFIEQLELERQLKTPPPSTDNPDSPEKKAVIFIGHGRSKLWARVKIFLETDLCLQTVEYESESRVGDSIIPILEKMLSQATFAVLILTAEDETADKKVRARQNVIHEAGLFQGRLGFKKAILLLQQGVEQFSNVDGLQYISFSGDNIEQTFYELQRCLKAQGQLK